MYEIISEMDTKIKIIQVYGWFLLKLHEVFGSEYSVIAILSLFEMFVFNFTNIFVLIGMAIMSDLHMIQFKPIIEHITYSSITQIKREYTIMTYFFGMTYMRDVIDKLLKSCVHFCLHIWMFICIKVYRRIVIYDRT